VLNYRGARAYAWDVMRERGGRGYCVKGGWGEEGERVVTARPCNPKKGLHQMGTENSHRKRIPFFLFD
jgi:hypothetical protein